MTPCYVNKKCFQRFFAAERSGNYCAELLFSVCSHEGSELEESKLSSTEKISIQDLLKADFPTKASATSYDLLSTDLILKRQRTATETVQSNYIDLPFVLSTWNICKRLFSAVAYVMSDRGKSFVARKLRGTNIFARKWHRFGELTMFTRCCSNGNLRISPKLDSNEDYALSAIASAIVEWESTTVVCFVLYPLPPLMQQRGTGRNEIVKSFLLLVIWGLSYLQTAKINRSIFKTN